MKNIKKEIGKIFKAKKAFHKELARMPFEKKIEILIFLQGLANSIKTYSKKV